MIELPTDFSPFLRRLVRKTFFKIVLHYPPPIPYNIKQQEENQIREYIKDLKRQKSQWFQKTVQHFLHSQSASRAFIVSPSSQRVSRTILRTVLSFAGSTSASIRR